MSSSRDAGYTREQAVKATEEKCEKSPTGKHESRVIAGRWPSCELGCKHCGMHLGYTK